MATIHIEGSATIESLKKALKTSSDAAHKTRIRAIMKLCEGKTKSAVAEELTIGRTSLIAWVKRYNTGGIPALALSKGGRKEGNPKWELSIFVSLAKEIDKGGYWSIPKMQEWLKQKMQFEIPEQTVWYRMDQLGYSYKGARPHPVLGDKERQETFKKGALPHSWSKE
jgi:transposase